MSRSAYRLALLGALIATPAWAAPGAAEAVHAAATPFDAHTDIPESFDPAKADQPGQGQFSLYAAAKGGLRGAAVAVFAPQGPEGAEALAKAQATAEKKHAIIQGIAAAFPAKAAIALTPADFRAITASGRFAIVESVVNGGAFVTSPADVDLWAKRGVRVFGFVHAGHNALADSSRPSAARGEGVSHHGGLSPLGKEVLARLNKDGVLVDVSQLSDAAFDDVLRLSKAPVIATHSDARALVPATRNLSDAQLDAIKVKGGVVAINAYPAYLRAVDTKPSVADLVATLDYVVKRIGVDHVALSTDFNHGGGVTGWQDEGDALAVTEELQRHGYSPAAITKIWSGNFLRVWGEAQRAAVK